MNNPREYDTANDVDFVVGHDEFNNDENSFQPGDNSINAFLKYFETIPDVVISSDILMAEGAKVTSIQQELNNYVCSLNIDRQMSFNSLNSVVCDRDPSDTSFVADIESPIDSIDATITKSYNLGRRSIASVILELVRIFS